MTGADSLLVGTPFNLGDSRYRLPGAIIALLLIGVVLCILVPESAAYVGFIGLVVGLGIGGVLFVTRSTHLTPRERSVWRMAAVSVSLFMAGVLAFAVASFVGAKIPAYGPLDTFFLAGYVAMMLVFYKMTRLDSGGREWVLTIADAMVGAVALAALTWSYWFERLNALWSGAPTWDVVVATLYPIIDVMLVVGLLILVLRRSHYYLDIRLVFFAGVALFQVFADFVYMSSSVGQTFTTAEPPWVLNLLATACIVATATLVERLPRKRDFAEGPTPIWALIWPYLFAGLLLWAHLVKYRALEPGTSEVVLLDGVIVIGVIIFLRQVYVIYRDRHHVDRKRAELVASVSHELRTPLTAMVGFLTLLDEHPDEFPLDARQEMISEATAQARHMSRLVSDLLMLARGDSSYLTLELEEVTAMSIVTSVLRGIDTGHTRVDEDLDAEAVVRVDPDRMKQALGNLLNNAIRYAGDQCLLVARVKGDDLILEVHDNGPGVPERFQTVVWAQFERGAHRLDAATPGLGIGLSIVQAVVESHGGRAEYRKSERLGGACFSLIVRDCVVGREARSRVTVGR
jgi:signal transduction histidine kinase